MWYRIGQMSLTILVGLGVFWIIKPWIFLGTFGEILTFVILVTAPAIVTFIINQCSYKDFYVPGSDEINTYYDSPYEVMKRGFNLGYDRFYSYIANKAVWGWLIQVSILILSITIYNRYYHDYNFIFLGAVLGQTISYWLIHFYLHI